MILGVVVGMMCLFLVWGVYVPRDFSATLPVTYDVAKGAGMNDIADQLYQKGIIKSPLFFKMYALASGNATSLQAGRYEVSANMSVAMIVGKFAAGDIVKNTLVIIEGWDMADIGDYLESQHFCSKQEFLAAAKQDYRADFPLLKNRPAGATLEGYLFPDTYVLATGATPGDLIVKMLAHFDKKLTPDLRDEIAKQKRTVFDSITMASLLEKEVRTPGDKKIVAGILHKRIAAGMPLQVDAAIHYITGKAPLSAKDLQINSHYNTYKYYGLPPGPIANPGMDSIVAAVYPQKSDYWFYLSDPKTGQTIFSKTLDEHNAAVAKYLR